MLRIRVVYDGRHTPVKIFFRLRLQNLFPGECLPSVVKCKWLAVVLCCACLRVEAMVSMSARWSKGNGHGFKWPLNGSCSMCSMPAVAERLRRAYPALPERAGVGSIPANPDARNVPSFRR
jgi:hypothetical protein